MKSTAVWQVTPHGLRNASAGARAPRLTGTRWRRAVSSVGAHCVVMLALSSPAVAGAGVPDDTRGAPGSQSTVQKYFPPELQLEGEAAATRARILGPRPQPSVMPEGCTAAMYEGDEPLPIVSSAERKSPSKVTEPPFHAIYPLLKRGRRYPSVAAVIRMWFGADGRVVEAVIGPPTGNPALEQVLLDWAREQVFDDMPCSSGLLPFDFALER